MEVGNEWQYLVYEEYFSLFGGSEGYYLEQYSNQRDTLIFDTAYFNWTRFPNHWFRYDTLNQTIFVLWNDSDNVFMDFTIPAESLITRFEPYYNYYVNAYVIEGNDTKGYDGYESYEFPELIATNLFFQNNGLIYRHENERWPGGFTYRRWYYIIQSNISGTNYSENHNPEIIIEPITKVSDSTFHLTFEVNHHYSHVYPDSTPHTSLNFIDTVKMHSFYSKGINVIQNPLFYGESISGTENWEINTILDMNLISDEYKFNYRIEAVDKGLLPHRSFAPDSGYFTAVYNTTTDVNEIEETATAFTLYQNYPNSFNPTTNIEFQIAEFGFVKIKVYDILGNEIATLVNEQKPAGIYEIEFNARNLPSGIYFYQLKAGNYIETKKMVLIK